MDFAEKNILVTQNALQNFGGSEIVTLELAAFFKSAGANVTVFTWFYNDPIKSEFEKRGITVTTDENDPFFKNVDFVWVHHQVLPTPIIESLNHSQTKPRFFFYHMSYMENLYLEQPYILNLEKNIADKSFFVSEESLEMNMKRNGGIFRKPSVLYNFSPAEFVGDFAAPEKPSRIGIVSNHPPEELKKAAGLLNNSGIHTEIIGHNADKYELVTADVLKRYDCIITIGKTIQYSLTLNIPVYLYDHFGGCGFLNKDNFEKALWANFSGRGFRQKKPEQIVSDIINKYKEARDFQNENHDMFKQKFSLPINIAKALKDVSPRQRNTLSEEYLNYLVAAESISKDRITTIYNFHNITLSYEKEIQSLKNTIASLENSKIVKLDKKIRSKLKSIKPTK